MAKSIIHSRKDKCFLCEGYIPTEEHHVFGASNRKNSEKYGLKVHLCHTCHNEPPYGVHHSKKDRELLQRYTQRVAMNYYGWTLDDWLAIFGKNYL